MPNITMELMKRILVADSTTMRENSRRLATLLTNGDTLMIASTQGTILSFSIRNRVAIPDTDMLNRPGDFGNLPAGEAFIAPVEGTTKGVLIVDGAIADIELDAPVEITIEEGIAATLNGE
jgi:leucyl aminopeptidase (aminopeptidase T)